MDPLAREHERDLVSDRPGRVFDHANFGAGRRGSVARHGTDGERSARKTEAVRFARKIAGELDTERRDGTYDRLVLMSPPTFLGLLRGTMSKNLQKAVVLEVPKDLVHCSDKVIGSHVPADAFALLV
jgi:protein required for attachment to host cells